SNVHMPLGNTALFNLRSKDVIHSVFIPHMRVKQDTVPGLRQKLWFKPNRSFLVDLKAPREKTGHNIYVLENNDWVKKEQEVQPRKFVYLDDDPASPQSEFHAKDFAPSGKLFDKKIAVLGYSEVNSIYDAPKFNGVPKKVKVLYQGKVAD